MAKMEIIPAISNRTIALIYGDFAKQIDDILEDDQNWGHFNFEFMHRDIIISEINRMQDFLDSDRPDYPSNGKD